jgi:hypothetical protein
MCRRSCTACTACAALLHSRVTDTAAGCLFPRRSAGMRLFACSWLPAHSSGLGPWLLVWSLAPHRAGVLLPVNVQQQLPEGGVVSWRDWSRILQLS